MNELSELHRPSWSYMRIEDERAGALTRHPLIILLWAMLDVFRLWRERARIVNQ
jgi:hypothetical protein